MELKIKRDKEEMVNFKSLLKKFNDDEDKTRRMKQTRG